MFVELVSLDMGNVAVVVNNQIVLQADASLKSMAVDVAEQLAKAVKVDLVRISVKVAGSKNWIWADILTTLPSAQDSVLAAAPLLV